MIQKHRLLLCAIIVALFTVGVLLTAYGFYSLRGYQNDYLVWRFGPETLALFAGLTLIIAIAGLWRGPDLGAVLIAGLSVVLLGNTVPGAVVCVLGISIGIVGRMILLNKVQDTVECLLVGAVVCATFLSLLIPFPVNNRGTWGLIFLLPLFAGPLIIKWKRVPVHSMWPVRSAIEPLSHLYLVKCGIGASIVIHSIVSMMPEIGHDALSMHLFVPAYVTHRHLWDYNSELYSWAVMPKLVNWLYTAAYMFGGETAARLMNLGAVILVGCQVRRLSRWAGANETGSNWGMLLFLLTPLTYLETSSLFIEGMWAALVLGGTEVLFRLLTDSHNRKRDLLIAAVLFGGAMSAKAVTYTHLPVLALLLLIAWRRWYRPDLTRTVVAAVLLFSVVAALPYLTAYRLTGNPVFPFFNHFFRSPLYPAENFKPPAIFDRGFRFETLYDMTFQSGRFLEGTAGAAGFQWLLLIVPGVFVLALFRRRRLLLVAVVCLGWLVLTFSQTAYLRYVFPGFALSGVVIAGTVSICRGLGRRVWLCCLAVLCLTLFLNLFHFQAATWYGFVRSAVITEERNRDAYLDHSVPVRQIVELVNELNRENEPVLFFSPPLTAGLKADALYVNWYNPALRDLLQNARTPADFERIFTQKKIRFIVIEDSFKTDALLSVVRERCTEVATINNTTLYKYTKGSGTE